MNQTKSPFEISENHIEKVIEGISRTMQESKPFDWEVALDPSGDSQDYYTAARCLVEPVIPNASDEEAYYEFLENDPDNWIGWVRSTFGEQWGQLAEKIMEWGY